MTRPWCRRSWNIKSNKSLNNSTAFAFSFFSPHPFIFFLKHQHTWQSNIKNPIKFGDFTLIIFNCYRLGVNLIHRLTRIPCLRKHALYDRELFFSWNNINSWSVTWFLPPVKNGEEKIILLNKKYRDLQWNFSAFVNRKNSWWL